MCLDRITKRYDPPDEKERRAWKLFYVSGGGAYEFPYFPHYCTRRVQTGRWLVADSYRIGLPEYPRGFHAYPTRAVARTVAHGWPVISVRVRGVHTEGIQDCVPVLVAREMFVPKAKPRKAK